MFKIRTYNKISVTGTSRLPQGRYEIGDKLEQPDAILVRSADLHQVEVNPELKAVARAGAGTNNVPVAELSKRGVVVFNAPGANANAVKELVLAGMLMAVRNLREATEFVRGLDPADPELEHKVEDGKKRFVGSEVVGRTLGVIGLGAIGVRVANAAKGIGMKVIGFDPHMTVEGAWQLSSEVDKAGSLGEVLAVADFITLHVPLNAATRGTINAAALAQAKDGLVVLNFAREGVVDEDAVIAALDSGKLGHYVTDFPTPRTIAHPKVVSFPHLGASTAEAEENCAVMVADQLRDYLENGNITNAVNFPSVRLPRAGAQRLTVANRNVPNMIGQLSHVLGEAGANIAQMHNASRGELAYNILDLDQPIAADVIAKVQGIEGILAVRVL
ncbi:MAG: 3-phosphoglycerate dehydrogenase [Xanthomonadales bacterium PRO6]|nr:D-3-phosphoglycerate dehydrogenase [Xanthomonadales bacterium]MCE7930545.1 3-phosphoglycerate dehydrogenase [Xanthomonadales bacterium PRO6]